MTAAEPAVDPAQVDEHELAASLAHDEWCNTMRRAGWRYGAELDLTSLTCPRLVPFAQLDEPADEAPFDDPCRCNQPDSARNRSHQRGGPMCRDITEGAP